MEIIKDVVIIGAGPAGMSAALYLSRSKISFSIVEKEMVGGKLNITTEIENYPGVGLIDGFALASKMKSQLKEKGIEIESEFIKDITKKKGFYILFGENNTYICKAVIIATGSTNKKIGIKNEDTLVGKGISYCAVCDAFFYRNKDVLVFANSRKGYLEALHLSNLVNTLYLVSDKDEDDEENNLSLLKEKTNVKFYTPYNIVSFNGDSKLSSVTIENKETKEQETIEVAGCFPFIGDVPSNYLVKKLNIENNNGYLIVDKFMSTNVEGIYAIGDIVDKPLRQIVTACSDGAIAATSVIKYINKLK